MRVDRHPPVERAAVHLRDTRISEGRVALIEKKRGWNKELSNLERWWIAPTIVPNRIFRFAVLVTTHALPSRGVPPGGEQLLTVTWRMRRNQPSRDRNVRIGSQQRDEGTPVPPGRHLVTPLVI